LNDEVETPPQTREQEMLKSEKLRLKQKEEEDFRKKIAENEQKERI
jgi:hypothetical protein